HHAATLRMYPRNWKPSGARQDPKESLKPGPPDDKRKQAGQPGASISTNTISTKVIAHSSGPSTANPGLVSATVTNKSSSLTTRTNDAPEPPTNLRVVSGQ
ncbi:MAG TPA: hypothetical protein VGY98_10545, partial [Verrucomicrobiae bacterium]|nr:hypothetical protein [Verrucomicrobiae bacterium]